LYLYWNVPKPLPPDNVDQREGFSKAIKRAEMESEIMFNRVGYRLNFLESENIWRDTKDVLFEKALQNAKIV
jgi:hypothetical protein